jgi:hypothetical protein
MSKTIVYVSESCLQSDPCYHYVRYSDGTEEHFEGGVQIKEMLKDTRYDNVDFGWNARAHFANVYPLNEPEQKTTHVTITEPTHAKFSLKRLLGFK